MTKKPFKTFSTGTLVAVGLSINSLYSNVIAEENPFDKVEQQPSSPAKKHKQPMEMSCGSNMRMDMKGMVMHENKAELPKDCAEVSEDITIKVQAGIEFAKQYPGTVFGFNEHQWQVKPCSRITVEFENKDDIRHQWMIHGLPKYLYPKGMFHLEVNGVGKKTGTFIVPSSNYTYLVHCDISQHMEKGMKAQLKVGNGRGDLPSIPGISDPTFKGSL